MPFPFQRRGKGRGTFGGKGKGRGTFGGKGKGRVAYITAHRTTALARSASFSSGAGVSTSKCTRCGRNTHAAKDCFASTHISGHELPAAASLAAVPNVKALASRSNSSASFANPNTKPAPASAACSRCGRDSHTAADCYAQSHASGSSVVEEGASQHSGASAKRKAPGAWSSGNSNPQLQRARPNATASPSTSSGTATHADLAAAAAMAASAAAAAANAVTAALRASAAQESQQGTGNNSIYHLVLSDGKHYVGKTASMEKRLAEHRSSQGSAWTRRHGIESHSILRSGVTAADASAMEQAETVRLMKEHGIDNVRGGPWTRLVLSAEERRHAESSVKHEFDLCRRCGRKGHFGAACYAGTDVITGQKLKKKG